MSKIKFSPLREQTCAPGPQMYGGQGPLQGPLAYLERTTSNIGGPMGPGMGGAGGGGMMNSMR